MTKSTTEGRPEETEGQEAQQPEGETQQEAGQGAAPGSWAAAQVQVNATVEAGGHQNGHHNGVPDFALDINDPNLPFDVDEEMVRSLVLDAQRDCHESLFERYQAYIHQAAVARHYKRFMRVMGLLARGKGFLKLIGYTLGVGIAIFAALWFNPQMNIMADAIFALAFTGFLWFLVNPHLQYQAAFVKLYNVERADFTDPGQVTGLCVANVPRLGFYYRPEVWRGNDGKNGLGDADAFLVVQTGYDKVDWHKGIEQEIASITSIADLESIPWTEEVWCDVERSKLVPEFRTAADYYGLPADTFTVNGDSMKMRRAWCRQLQRNGEMYAKFEKGGWSWLEGNWGWFYCFGALALTAFFVVIAFD